MEAIESFYQCTGLPCRFYGPSHKPLASAGLTEDFSCLIEEYQVYKKMLEKLCVKEDSSHVTITLKESICFTGFFSCEKYPDKGIYLLGPYATEAVQPSSIPFKPEKFIPNLVTLMHSIAKTCALVGSHLCDKNKTYSLYVKKAIDYLYENYSDPISLDELAEHININKCYFCNLFKKEVNKTVSQFLNEIRIEKSKELLLDNNTSVLDVALNVGFNNQNYYNMTFKKLTGFTPLEYRNRTLNL